MVISFISGNEWWDSSVLSKSSKIDFLVRSFLLLHCYILCEQIQEFIYLKIRHDERKGIFQILLNSMGDVQVHLFALFH